MRMQLLYTVAEWKMLPLITYLKLFGLRSSLVLKDVEQFIITAHKVHDRKEGMNSLAGWEVLHSNNKHQTTCSII